MSVIVPAILPASLADVEMKLARLDDLVRDVQIDLVDGKFAGPACWPYLSGGLEELRNSVGHGERFTRAGQYRLEIDLMVQDPIEAVAPWIAAGASRLVIHTGSAIDIGKVIIELESRYGYGYDFDTGLLALGLAVYPATDLALIEPYVSDVDFIQFMGIESIGKQGQPFDPRILRQIKNFRAHHPDMPIQVDGGVSLITAPELLAAGAGRLIVGSALWRAVSLDTELSMFNTLVAQFISS